MNAGICRSWPFKWYPTARVGRFDYARESGVVLHWLGWRFYVVCVRRLHG